MSTPDTLELVGKTFDEKYVIESVVGEGGFAVVYKAMHLLWKRPVAVKVFKALADVKEEQRAKLLEDFIQEGKLLADLSERSAAICQARDIGMYTTPKGDVLPYMVLEWLDGASLEDVLLDECTRKIPPRTMEEAMRLMEPAAEALALAHVQLIAHRDVKPANVFVLGADPRADTATVKLLDFGIAKVVQDVQKMGGAFSKTSGQITSFTPMYGAPEQFNRSHGATGPWTDVFAFALVMVEILTYKEPITGDNLMQLAFASADPARRPTPRTHGAVVSNEVEKVFAKAVAVAPHDRHATAGEFWNDLRAAMRLDPLRGITGRGGRASALPSTPSAPRVSAVPASNPDAQTMAAPLIDDLRTAKTAVPDMPRSKSPLIVAAVAGIALLAGGGFVVASRSSATSQTPQNPAGSASVAPIGMASAPATSASAAPANPCGPGMRLIPGGQFFMGSEDKEALPFEKPTHNVKLVPFCIDEFEVTTEAYKACSDPGACRPHADYNEWAGITDKERKVYDPLCNRRDPSGHARHPMNCVDWEMATLYCKNAGARLPTEAEWEFAARGPDGRRYPWGPEEPSSLLLNACGKECVAWSKESQRELLVPMYPEDDGFPNTAPVGSFPKGKSRYGVQDVVGNVWEWVSDFYAPYTADDVSDPQGPKTGDEHVIRGGAWNGTKPSWVRPTFRYKAEAAKRSYGTGFRCAKSL